MEVEDEEEATYRIGQIERSHYSKRTLSTSLCSLSGK